MTFKSLLHRNENRTFQYNDIHSLSERPGSNRRHSAWKADALPTELLSHFSTHNSKQFEVEPCEQQPQYHRETYVVPHSVGRAAPTLRGNLRSSFCGESRIRTCEDVVSRFTVCPRWPLEYLPSLIHFNI